MTSREMTEALMAQTGMIDPGDEMFVILHTGEEGMVPPPHEEAAQTGGFTGEGTGSGHAFGPFVNEEEAKEWQMLADRIRPCSCRKALVPVIVPRILAVVGPAGIPLEVEDDHSKDRLN